MRGGGLADGRAFRSLFPRTPSRPANCDFLRLEPAFQHAGICREVSQHPPLRALEDACFRAALIDHAPRPRAGGVDETKAIAAADDDERDMAVEPDHIHAGFARFDLRGEGLVFLADAEVAGLLR